MPREKNKTALRSRIEDLKQQVAGLKAALLEGEDKFRALTDSAPVGIFVDDAQGKAIYVNKKCAELVGVPAEEALNFDWIPFLHPDDRERMVSEWTNAFENSAEFRMEYRWVHSDGNVVWTLGEVVPILGADGKATLFIGTLTDITAHKKAEIEKEDLKAQLVQAQKMESIGRLAGGVAHDYNNMLNVILGNTEMAMAQVDESGTVYDHLQEIFKAARRSAEVTRQLLAFARKQIVLPNVFDMNDSVKEMLNMLGRLIGEDIQLAWVPQAGRIPVKMDPTQFDRIVVNLCINARDAIDGIGKITLETATVTIDETYCAEHMGSLPGEFAMLSIGDNGSGMDKATLENIFEPFFTTKGENMGTGLGLASVYGTVKQNNGFIDVQSEPGTGTIIKIYLPRYTGPMSEDKAPEPEPFQEGRGQTVLVVEDEVAILDLIKRSLDKFGYKVLAAETSSEALNLERDCNEEIALLITDVIMPEINGWDLANRLRSNRPNMKCLYMSGYTADVIANQGVLEKNVNFIQKPFSVKDLIAKVHETLNGK
ncbi:MAG: PAS domain S-box protein [Desulfobacterales bacterium]|nr:PAS domain S-box protein [Desulfobacterales bacterium]